MDKRSLVTKEIAYAYHFLNHRSFVSDKEENMV